MTNADNITNRPEAQWHSEVFKRAVDAIGFKEDHSDLPTASYFCPNTFCPGDTLVFILPISFLVTIKGTMLLTMETQHDNIESPTTH